MFCSHGGGGGGRGLVSESGMVFLEWRPGVFAEWCGLESLLDVFFLLLPSRVFGRLREGLVGDLSIPPARWPRVALSSAPDASSRKKQTTKPAEESRESSHGKGAVLLLTL